MKATFPRIDDPQWWRDRPLALSSEEAFGWFAAYESGWWYDGDPDPKKAHAKLTSGKCSDGYYNCRDLFGKNPRICAIFAVQLVRILCNAGLVGEFDWVVGSSYSAMTLSYEVAKILGVSHGFTETEKDGPKKKRQIWRDNIPAGSKILQVEELITTLKTTWQVRKAVLESNPDQVEFLPYVATAVHRPAKLPIDYGDQWKIIAFLKKAVWADEPEKCPYCKVGSKRYKPKANWAKLTGKS